MTGGGPAPRTSAEGTDRKMTAPASPILVVEDNGANLLVLRMMLRKMGHEVIEAKNGRCGVDMAIAHRPQLILMDLRMPEMDGIAAAAEIRSTLGAGAPIMVAVTATITPEQRVQCADTGFADLIAKPISFTHLSEIVERYTG
jgi:two-component system, sensor histidine kinase